MAWLGLYGFAWNDYEIEVKPAFDALIAGQVGRFLALAPAYGGSLIERAPFAMLPSLWGGGTLAVYRAVAIPCLLAGVALAVWLCAQMRGAGRPWWSRVLTAGLCVASPLALQALELGHPEEILGACLCIAAVLLASRQHPLWAGALLGLAVANKEWALIAVGPVLLALSCGVPALRVRQMFGCATAAALAAGLTLAPLLVGASGGFAASTGGATLSSANLFQPWQVWWFFGWHGGPVRRLFTSEMPGYRIGPAWASTISHPLIVAVAVLAALALWQQRRRAGAEMRERDALLLLALVLLLRCVLDTWDTGYYMLPFLLALTSWEVLGRRRLAPSLTVATTLAPWVVLEQLSANGVSPDAQAVLFLAWTLPLAGALALALYAPGLIASLGSGDRRSPGRRRSQGREPVRAPQPTTMSSLGSPFSSS